MTVRNSGTSRPDYSAGPQVVALQANRQVRLRHECKMLIKPADRVSESHRVIHLAAGLRWAANQPSTWAARSVAPRDRAKASAFSALAIASAERPS
jgi:hypothetical protein